MKKNLIIILSIFVFTNYSYAQCNLTGGSVYIDHSNSPWMMNATVNGMSGYSYVWSNGGSANQTQFYTQWCVTITDIITGCDTTICQDCIPDTTALCACPMIYMPVCGCDGNMYPNSCVADCADVAWTPAVSNGMPGGFLPCSQCIDSSLINLTILCMSIWDPVCGCDSVTYSNDCIAEYHNGVTSWTQGACNSSPPPPCTVDINNGDVDIKICDGDTAILEATTGFDTYLWTLASTGTTLGTTHIIEVTDPGLYIVIVTDSTNCVDIDSIEVIVYPSTPLNQMTAPNPPEICVGDSVVIEVNQGFINYWWNTGNPLDQNENRVVVYPTHSLIYIVEALDSNGCESREEILVLVDTCATGIYSEMLSKINIYPNPTSRNITIDLPENQQFNILLYEMNGRLINSWEQVSNQLIIDQKISRGVYLLKIKNDNYTNYFKLIRK